MCAGMLKISAILMPRSFILPQVDPILLLSSAGLSFWQPFMCHRQYMKSTRCRPPGVYSASNSLLSVR